MAKMIIIDNITVNTDVEITIFIAQNKETIKMSFSDNVKDYLTVDRADAPLMGLLMFAIRHKMDIESRFPVSETLLYKLTHHFIPGICGDRVFRPKIKTKVIADLKNNYDDGIVATGVSCGIDSLYTIMEHTGQVTDGYKLNRLVFLDAGAHHFGAKEKWGELYAGRLKNAENFSKESELPLIKINTNLPVILEKYSDYDHIEHHTYMMLSCILMIQKGVRKYYYSGGYSYGQFNCNLFTDKALGCAHYDLFILWCASNAGIEFLSTGGSLNRFEKVKALSDYPLAEKYLNVCVQSVHNCGKCFKCKRTLLELDAAGIVDSYSAVFDIEEYKRRRAHLLKEGFRNAIKGQNTMDELVPFFKKNITTYQRILQRFRVTCGKIVMLFR